VKAVVESTGNLWIQIHDRLEEHDFVALSNPGETRLIAEAKVKMDKVDAKILARLLRAEMLPTCYVPDEEQRSQRELLRYRLKLVKNRTEVKNRIHALLHKHGLRMPHPTPFSKKSIKWLREQSLEFMDDAILRSDADRVRGGEDSSPRRGGPAGAAADDHDRRRPLHRHAHPRRDLHHRQVHQRQ